MRVSYVMLIVVVVPFGCGGSQAAPETNDDDSVPEPVKVDPDAVSGSDSDPGGSESESGSGAGGGTAGGGSGGGAGGDATCTADASHCCQPDGTVVRPGGCMPMYPDNVVPGLLRGEDGVCVRDPEPCTVRCLPSDARIATPHGEVRVVELRVGDPVYTEDPRGARLVVPVIRVSATPLRGPHPLLELRLDDGRHVRASAGHPDADGHELRALRVGESFDGARVVATETVPYRGTHTFDLLPGGATGVYWADGVRLGSTLR